jgi:hypothetical protein
MNLLSNSLQAYEKNQNLAGWVHQTEQAALENEQHIENELKSDDVTISTQREIYDWIAQSLPTKTNNPADIGQVNQQLYEYGLIDMPHQAKLNELIAENPDQPIAKSIEGALDTSTSYQNTQVLKQVAQVFNNLAAAQQAYSEAS